MVLVIFRFLLYLGFYIVGIIFIERIEVLLYRDFGRIIVLKIKSGEFGDYPFYGGLVGILYFFALLFYILFGTFSRYNQGVARF